MRQHLIKLVFIVYWVFSSTVFLAQESPPPPGEHGSGDNKAPGGGAPVDGGVLTFILMATGYGVVKYARYRNVKHV